MLALALAAAVLAVDVPDTLGKELDKAKDQSAIPVLLPQTVKTDQAKAFGNLANVGQGRYTLVIGASKKCNGASICGIATFVGGLDKTPGGRRVPLVRDRTGRYFKPTCGANCSFAAIEWNDRGTRYRIEYKESTGAKNMKRLANSAIRKGPR